MAETSKPALVAPSRCTSRINEPCGGCGTCDVCVIGEEFDYGRCELIAGHEGDHMSWPPGGSAVW